MPEVRELAEALCDALAAFEPGRYSGADCVALTELLSRTANSCQVAGARAATKVAECGAYRDRGFTNPVDWLARAAGSSARAARAALSTVAAVKDCPATRDALVAGKVSLAQAAADHVGARGRGRAARTSRCVRVWERCGRKLAPDGRRRSRPTRSMRGAKKLESSCTGRTASA